MTVFLAPYVYAESANTDTQASGGFVALCGFVFLQTQQRSVCLKQSVAHMMSLHDYS